MEEAVKKYGIIERNNEKYYTYEVDGYGNDYFMDDANIPSLLSLPYLGYCSNDDPLYLQTRKNVLSTKNPYYWKVCSLDLQEGLFRVLQVKVRVVLIKVLAGCGLWVSS